MANNVDNSKKLLDNERPQTKMLSSTYYVPTEEDKSYKAWKHFIPFRSGSRDPKALPLMAAGPINYATIHWMNKLIYKAYKTDLTIDDLYQLPWKDCSSRNSERFEKIWKEELETFGEEEASVTRAVYKMIKSRVLCASIIIFSITGFAILGPAVPMKILTTTLSLPQELRPSQFFLLAMDILLVFCQLILTFFVSSVIPLIMANAGIRARAGVLSYVYKKILETHVQSYSAGELINLCANDGQRIFDACLSGVFSLGAFISLVGAAYSVYLLGLWGLLGFGVFFLSLPLKIYLSKKVFNNRSLAIPVTERRVTLTTEIINAIKLVKMYAWEKPYSKEANEIRRRERGILELSLFLQSILATLPWLIPQIATGVTFLAMTLSGNDLTLTQAFVFLSLLNSLVFTLSIIPFSMKSLAEGRHACQRIKAILVAKGERMTISPIRDHNNLIEIRNGYFGWGGQVSDSCQGGQSAGNLSTYGSIHGSTPSIGSQQSLSASSENKPLLSGDSNDLESEDEGDNHTALTLHNISLSLRKGSLVGVCGTVGSGKSSLMQAILGLMVKESGEMAIDQSKRIAYVAQQAWSMNATVQDNIVFGQQFDRKKYQRVVEACALLSDFDQLPEGDQTEIGERGINLSGGQKQRISIARAVYSNSDIILLDDPLSAVDAHVGQHIFTHCLKDVLRNKTVLFVTHQLQFLTGCDYVLVMEEGRIVEEGTHVELMSFENGKYAKLIKSFHNAEDEEATEEDFGDLKIDSIGEIKRAIEKVDSGLNLDEEDFSDKSGKLSEFSDESSKLEVYSSGEAAINLPDKTSEKLKNGNDLEQDRVKFTTYSGYMRAAGGFGVTSVVVAVVFLSVTIQAFSNYWLSLWISAGDNPVFTFVIATAEQNASLINAGSMLDNPNLTFYQSVYVGSLVLTVLAILVKSWFYVKVSLNASFKLHKDVFRKLVYSPMRFFDVTPSGQILNRFSKDMDEVDSLLPFLAEQLLYSSCILLTTFVIIALVFPYFLLAMLPVVIVFFLLYRFCQKGIHETKRIDNITRSPLYSHIATTIQGLSTIRAYEKEEQFLMQFNKLQDRNNMAYFLFQTAMRWAGVRLDSLSLFVVCVTSLFITCLPATLINPSLAALALSYAMNVSGLFQHTMRLAVETKATFTSVERIKHYIEVLESEAPSIIKEKRPHPSWPRAGAIQFSNVDMRYREGLPLVLKNITLDIKSQEKIGIVGRTGSGKSSMAMALFRMMELDGGSITIDGIDISTIGLEDLRSKLSIIPQDPVLFVGTVRYNLDPFKKYSDTQLWSALSKCHVKRTIEALDGGLDASIAENGDNFSVGERQLMCMARALLRHSKVLLMDEATAGIDTETDSLIQETITEAFADCTMLTIAHRLNTVVNYDRILVLDNGNVLEFDSPANLLADKLSVFAQMMAVQESQKKSAIMS